MSWNKVFSNPVGGNNLVVEWSQMGAVLRVVGPVYRMIKLPVGARGKYGYLVTEHTQDWARIGYEKISDRGTMQRPRQSGHEIEGKITIRGETYNAFTSGGENPDGGDGMIIVRSKPKNYEVRSQR